MMMISCGGALEAQRAGTRAAHKINELLSRAHKINELRSRARRAAADAQRGMKEGGGGAGWRRRVDFHDKCVEVPLPCSSAQGSEASAPRASTTAGFVSSIQA